MSNYQSIFDDITNDERYQRGLDWGKPRPGHPEGTIRAHIAELEGNLELLHPKLSGDDYWKLKILIHTHDTFKAEAQHDSPINSPRSHASLARAFLAHFVEDPDLLAMVQYHDEPFALWKQFKSKGKFSEQRMTALLKTIHEWNLFLAFLIVDGCTDGKSREPLHWFFQQIEGKVQPRFTEDDIF